MAKIIFIPGSLRKDSLNKKLLEVCIKFFEQKAVECHLVAQSELNVPLINTDDEQTKFPATIKAIVEKINAADGVVFGVPEYNSGISPVIKNFVDWTSRLKPHPWKGKSVLLVGTSPSDFGAISGLAHTRDPFPTGIKCSMAPSSKTKRDKKISKWCWAIF